MVTNNASRNQIDLKEMYEWLPCSEILSERSIFDFSLARDDLNRICAIWSEYNYEKDDEVSFYSRLYDGSRWNEPFDIYSGKKMYPDFDIASGAKEKIYLLFGKVKGAFDQLLLKVCDGGKWGPERKIIDIKTHIFGYKIAASQKSERIYLVFGDYRERHYFPYILTVILSGHVCERFGKLYLLKGDGTSWDTPRKITRSGNFSCSQPYIRLNDEMQRVHFVWEDERLGYRNKAIFHDSFHENRFEGNRKTNIDLSNTFAPCIECDNKDNLYVVWSTFEGDEIGKLYFRYRIDNSWSKAIELADRSVINSLSADTLGNIHFVWGDGSHIFYKIKCESFWTKTIRIEGQKARICIDKNNDVHLVTQKITDERNYMLIHSIFRFKR